MLEDLICIKDLKYEIWNFLPGRKKKSHGIGVSNVLRFDWKT